MEATRSSETSVDFRKTTRRYVLDDRTVPNHFCDLKSYKRKVGVMKAHGRMEV
jgi:hypothetical protein